MAETELFGSNRQLIIQNLKDLKEALSLPLAHWVATAAPTHVFDLPEEFIKLLDPNQSGSIHAQELQDLGKWFIQKVESESVPDWGSTTLTLEYLNHTDNEAIELKKHAEEICKDKLELDKLNKHIERLTKQYLEGDNIIPGNSLEESKLKSLLLYLQTLYQPVKDASGLDGIDEATLKAFYPDAEKFLNREQVRKQVMNGEEHASFPYGCQTETFYGVYQALKEPMDRFFEACELAYNCQYEFDPQKDLKDTSISAMSFEELKAANAHCLLQPPTKNCALDLTKPVHLDFEEKISDLALKLSIKNQVFTREQWLKFTANMTIYEKWLADAPSASFKVDDQLRLEEMLENNLVAEFQNILNNEKNLQEKILKFQALKKIILCQQNLLKLSRSFISFHDLLDASRLSIIQAGTLIIDGNFYNLNQFILDIKSHKKICQTSNLCVLYVDLPKEIFKNKKLACAITNGSVLNLFVGKKGVFVFNNKNYEVSIVDMIRQPVSISEGLRMPFVKLREFIEKQTEKISSQNYSILEKNVSAGLTDFQKKKEEKKPPTSSALKDYLLGGSVAVAALGSSFAYVLKTFANLWPWKMISIIFGVFLIIFMP